MPTASEAVCKMEGRGVSPERLQVMDVSERTRARRSDCNRNEGDIHYTGAREMIVSFFLCSAGMQ